MFRNTLTLLFVFQSLLAGCTASGIKSSQPASVTSDPSGADVYANGVKVGQTPLHHNLYKAFPAGWKDWVYTAQGVLLIKKAGCQDYILDVNDAILSKPIHARLDCQAGVVEKMEQPERLSKPASVSPDSDDQQAGQSVETERRLRELDSLHQKGLVTQDEYKRIRERILGDI